MNEILGKNWMNLADINSELQMNPNWRSFLPQYIYVHNKEFPIHFNLRQWLLRMMNQFCMFIYQQQNLKGLFIISLQNSVSYIQWINNIYSSGRTHHTEGMVGEGLFLPLHIWGRKLVVLLYMNYSSKQKDKHHVWKRKETEDSEL